MMAQAGLVSWQSISLKGDPLLTLPDASSWEGGWTAELWQDVGGDNTAGWQNTLPTEFSPGANGADNDIGLGLIEHFLKVRVAARNREFAGLLAAQLSVEIT